MATTIVEDFVLPDGTPDTGKVTFRLSDRSFQPVGGIHRTTNDVVVPLVGGSISVQLEPTAGVGADWAVPGVHYIVTESLGKRAGKANPDRTYRVDVPTSGSPVRLGELDHL